MRFVKIEIFSLKEEKWKSFSDTEFLDMEEAIEFMNEYNGTLEKDKEIKGFRLSAYEHVFEELELAIG